EEVGFGQRHPFVQLVAGLAERHADGLRLDDGPKLALRRLGRLQRDDLQAIEQRQAGLDAAHDDVDGIGKRVEELVLAALLEKRQHPEWKTGAGGKAGGERRQETTA